MTSAGIARCSIAAVWLYQGLWCKVLAGSARHAAIAAAIPVCIVTPGTVLVAVGCVETLLALWVLSNWRVRACAVAQTALLIAMNAAGLIFARAEIPDPGAMLTQNAAFLVLIWRLSHDL